MKINKHASKFGLRSNTPEKSEEEDKMIHQVVVKKNNLAKKATDESMDTLATSKQQQLIPSLNIIPQILHPDKRMAIHREKYKGPIRFQLSSSHDETARRDADYSGNRVLEVVYDPKLDQFKNKLSNSNEQLPVTELHS